MRGSIRQLVLFDVADEIDLDELRAALRIPRAERLPAFSRPAPDYVRFEQPPVVETLHVDRIEARAKYYRYGAVCVEFDEQFSLDWPQLVEKAASRISDSGFEQRAVELLKERIAKAEDALINPYGNWLSEDYTLIAVTPEPDDGTAAELIAREGSRIAQIVRGETRPLSESECQEILSAQAHPSEQCLCTRPL